MEEVNAGGQRMKVTHKGFEEIENDPVEGRNQLKTDEINYRKLKKSHILRFGKSVFRANKLVLGQKGQLKSFLGQNCSF